MKIIPPIIMTDAIFTSSNVLENDGGYSTYNAGVSFALNQYVLVTTGGVHKIYQSLVASNLGNAVTDNTKWLDTGSTNKWKMHDQSVQSQTTNAVSIVNTYQIVGRCNSAGFLNMDCASVTVTMTDMVDGIVYNKTVNMVSDSGINNLYMYFTEPIVRKTDLVLTDLPNYANTIITITISAPSGTAKCGGLILGNYKDAGGTQYGCKFGRTSYSVKTQDAFGNYTVNKRGYRKTGDFTIMVPVGYVDQLQQLLTDIDSIATLFVGSDSYASSIIYGFVGDASTIVSYPTMSLCNINIQGLT